MSYVNWQVSFIAIDNPRSQCQPCIDLRVSVAMCVCMFVPGGLGGDGLGRLALVQASM